jgi:hypothetical protein
MTRREALKKMHPKWDEATVNIKTTWCPSHFNLAPGPMGECQKHKTLTPCDDCWNAEYEEGEQNADPS